MEHCIFGCRRSRSSTRCVLFLSKWESLWYMFRLNAGFKTLNLTFTVVNILFHEDFIKTRIVCSLWTKIVYEDTVCFKIFINRSPDRPCRWWKQLSIIYLAYLNQRNISEAGGGIHLCTATDSGSKEISAYPLPRYAMNEGDMSCHGKTLS